MAYPKYQGYQYETSPRKLQPEYEPIKNPYQKKKSSVKKVKKQENKKQVKKQTKKQMQPKAKLVICIAIGFATLFAISYQNSLITESFNKKEELKRNLATIEKENEQLKVNIEKTLNLNNVEQSAKEMLGMQKLDNTQKKYISLPKEDFIESSVKEVIVDEKVSLWEKIAEAFSNLLK